MMPRPATLIALFLAALLGGVSGFLAWRFLVAAPAAPAAPDIAQLRPPPPRSAVQPDLIGTRRPDIEMPDVHGRPRSLDEWQGQVLVINFWATWCAPCREEMPMLVDLQRELGERGLQVLGVAMDEVAAVKAFATEFGVDYPLMAGGAEVMTLVREYGNQVGAIPYTAVVGRDGRIVQLQAGLVHREDLLPLLLRIL